MGPVTWQVPGRARFAPSVHLHGTVNGGITDSVPQLQRLSCRIVCVPGGLKAANAVCEGLRRSPRSVVLLATALQEPKVAPELVVKLVGRVSSHIKTAAPRWTVVGKSGDQHRAVGTDDAAHLLDIPDPVDRIGQKMKDSTIMPHVG